MLQIKDLLLSPIAPFMSCHALPFVPNLYRIGFDGRLHFPAGGHWRGIEVRPYPHATRTVHCGKAHLGQVKTLGRERQQMLLLSLHRRSDVLLPPANRPLLVRLTPRQQLPVELLQIPRLWHRYPVIAPEISHLAFDPSFLLRRRRRTEFGREPPVGAKGNETCCLFPLMSPQDFLHRLRQVVIADARENSAKILEGQLVGFEKGLLRRAWVGPMKRPSTRHTAQREDVQLLPVSAQIGIGLVEIRLRFAAPLIALRHEGLAADQTERFLLLPHITTYCRFGYFAARLFHSNPLVDPMCRMSLLAGCSGVAFQNRVDKGNHTAQLRSLPLRFLPSGRHRTGQSFSHHAPMHS